MSNPGWPDHHRASTPRLPHSEISAVKTTQNSEKPRVQSSLAAQSRSRDRKGALPPKAWHKVQRGGTRLERSCPAADHETGQSGPTTAGKPAASHADKPVDADCRQTQAAKRRVAITMAPMPWRLSILHPVAIIGRAHRHDPGSKADCRQHRHDFQPVHQGQCPAVPRRSARTRLSVTGSATCRRRSSCQGPMWLPGAGPAARARSGGRI